MTSAEDVLKSLSSDDWQWIANHLQKWHYVTDEDRPWLTGGTISRFIEPIQDKLREYGYTGGNLAVHAFDVPERGWLYLAYDSERYPAPTLAEQAYLTEEPKRWHDRVTVRVDDWLDRLTELQKSVTQWVSELNDREMRVVDAGAISMNEELMQRYNVPPVAMHAFSVVRGNEKLATFRPKALWIVGANGRVDVVTAKEAPILVDESESLTRPERWQLYSSDKRGGVEFSKEVFVKLLGVK